MIFRGLLYKFKSGVLPLMQKELQKSLNQVENIKDKICKTIVSVTYLRKGYPHRTGAWELVVTKAETWISSIVHSHSVVQELERTAAANWIGTEIYDDEQLDPEGGVSLGAPNSNCYPSPVPKYNSSARPSNSRASSISTRQRFQPGEGGVSLGASNSNCYPSSVPEYNSSASPSNSGASSMSTRQWFQPGEGIAREVITADIQRYLGPDAQARPGEGTGEYEVGFPLF